MEPALARALWHRLETINAVTYFCRECRDGPADLGLQGFWMGYFACRAAPMGAVEPGVVEAAFFNFHPERVRRAIPSAWNIASPAELVTGRARAAATALRRILGDAAAERLADSVRPVAREAIAVATGAGRPLFAANRDVDEPVDPVEALWQAATTLREHRGDAHVALLTGAGFDGCEVHVLFSASEDVPAELFQQSRGWSLDDWQAATERLVGRGLLDGDGRPTPRAADVRDGIERRTDELAAEPFSGMADQDVEDLLGSMDPAVGRIAAAGDIIFPNPMGLPKPTV